ncbi:MAG: sigma-70 family RNA polymerase sigma factor [Prevotella sp.]|nr:sigma-70 family RNA polymerase sigma factor [Prevotella sp.]
MPNVANNSTDKNGEEGILERYIGEISSYAPLTDEEEAALSRRALAGDETARRELVNANLKFVVSVARGYVRDGVSMLDLINEGNIALLRASKKFNASGGQRFANYAVRGIRKAMETFCPSEATGRQAYVRRVDSDTLPSLPADFDDSSVDTEEFAALVSALPPRERLVMKASFGVGERQMTMREIGTQYGMTRERVRQIRKRALRRLAQMKKG